MKNVLPKRKIHRIVVTGGPCGGKTTIISILSQKLSEAGYRVFVVPEVATMLIGGGVVVSELRKNPQAWEVLQETILRFQFDIEKRFLRLAKAHKGKIVIIYDRGTMDVMAYMDRVRFINILKRTGNTISQARDSRYDAVIHLVTAANGAEDFYNLTSNSARYETAEEARIRDSRTMNAWLGHEHFRVIGNRVGDVSINFETKMHLAVEAVFEALGIPEPIEREHKYLLEAFQKPPKDSIGFEIIQTYLNSSDPTIERRVRKKNQIGESDYIFTYAEKIVIKGGAHSGPKERIERERLISKREYLAYLLDRDPHREDILKTRYVFVWENQYFQMDFIVHPTNLVLLEVELTKSQSTPILPSEIKVIRDVTSDSEYSNSNIAKRLSL